MIENTLYWYKPSEKIPAPNKKLVNDIIWIDMSNNICLGYLSYNNHWVYKTDDDFDDDLYDLTEFVKFWAYLIPLNILIDNY